MIVDHEVEQGNDDEHGLSKLLWKETEQCALPETVGINTTIIQTIPNQLKRPDLSVRAQNPSSALVARDVVQSDLRAVWRLIQFVHCPSETSPPLFHPLERLEVGQNCEIEGSERANGPKVRFLEKK
jgi:hypothetical protein